MENFNFYAPTQVVFGKNAEAQVGELVKAQHCKKVLVHFGGNSAKKSGLSSSVWWTYRRWSVKATMEYPWAM